MSEEADPPSTGGRKAEASAETRRALLEAGAALLREEPVGSVLSQLTARSVSARGGRTTGAFFHQWRSQEAYQHDLLAFVLDPRRIESIDEAEAAIFEGIRTADDPLQVLEDVARGTLDSMRRDPYIPLWHALWAKHGQDPYIHDLISHHITYTTAQVERLLDAVVTAAGRRYRPPFSIDALAIAITAVAQGLVLRVSIEPDRVPTAPPGTDEGWDLYATTVRTLVEAFTEPAAE